MLKVAWANRGSWTYGWKILRHGVCDGCSLGPHGLRDNVINGTHLCLTRLNLLRLNTMGPLKEATWQKIGFLRSQTNEQLHSLGRIPYPLIYRSGDSGFRRVSWEEAVAIAARSLETTSPERMGFFASSRGLTNEAYYAFQKLARIAGTANIDSCARLCHAASTSALKQSIGWGAATCSLRDLIGTDLVLLFGTDLANNQPMMMKYLHYAKKQGTQVVVVNPFKEPALEHYWVPSVATSALFGTRIADDFFLVAPGGDVALITGLLKSLVASRGLDETYIASHTVGFDELKKQVEQTSWGDIEAQSGLPRVEIERLAALYQSAKTSILIWSMGLTQHRHGVDNVRAIANLALARGNIGRAKTGVMPIRGHSGVQGTAECGADADKFPGGVEINESSAANLEALWQHAVPARPGLRAAHLLDRATTGDVDFLYMMGGNYLDTLPDPMDAARALSRVRLRIHQDIIINSSALVEPATEDGTILLLPAQTRYEQRGGGTSTSTERRIRFTPEIGGHQIGDAKPEWEIPTLVGRALLPERPDLFPYQTSADVRVEMERVIPLYKGISGLQHEGDWVQWGGEQLGSNGRFDNMPDGRARFVPVALPNIHVPAGHFFLASRRGKQFNSIIQGDRDGITGAPRNAVFLAKADAKTLGLESGDPIIVRNQTSSMRGVCIIGPCRPGHVQAFWPECNVLIRREYDPISGEPDYNAIVTIESARSANA